MIAACPPIGTMMMIGVAPQHQVNPLKVVIKGTRKVMNIIKLLALRGALMVPLLQLHMEKLIMKLGASIIAQLQHGVSSEENLIQRNPISPLKFRTA